MQPPSSDWGLMIAEARAYLEQAPWIALAPGFALSVTIISINLIGEGLRQFLDVRRTSGRLTMRPILEIEGLKVAYGARPALHGIDLRIDAGQAVGVVGESGSGKSTVAWTIMGLLPPGAAVTGGSARFEATDLLTLTADKRRRLRGEAVAMVFQDPFTTLKMRRPSVRLAIGREAPRSEGGGQRLEPCPVRQQSNNYFGRLLTRKSEGRRRLTRYNADSSARRDRRSRRARHM